MYPFFRALQLAPFDPTKKKKKKKVVIQDPSDEADKLADKTESLASKHFCTKKKQLVIHWIIFDNVLLVILSLRACWTQLFRDEEEEEETG